jgi:hypothetical protein
MIVISSHVFDLYVSSPFTQRMELWSKYYNKYFGANVIVRVVENTNMMLMLSQSVRGELRDTWVASRSL